jgi:hypothetical protein
MAQSQIEGDSPLQEDHTCKSYKILKTIYENKFKVPRTSMNTPYNGSEMSPQIESKFDFIKTNKVGFYNFKQ